jgi:hypothetical protein
MKSHACLSRSYFFVVVLIIIFLIILYKFKANELAVERSVNQAYQECRFIGFSIFSVYVEDSNSIIAVKNASVDAEVVFNVFLRMDKLSGIEYLTGPSRIYKSKKMGLLLDPWGNPYVIKVTELQDQNIGITIISNGPDRIGGTSDDLLFKRTY